MAFDGTVTCWIPDIPTIGRQQDVRLRVASFGDGYAQRTLDGINAVDMKWTLTWENRPKDVVEAMVAYLIARKGSSFLFKEQPTGNLHQVWCDKWKVDWTYKRNKRVGWVKVPEFWGTLSAEFVKAYGVTA
jgi:phage-related protein